MATFAEIVQSHEEHLKITVSGRAILGSSRLSKKLNTFFGDNDCTNLEFFDRGSSAIIIKDSDNPAIIYRIAPNYSADDRAVIPQVLQPIFTKK